MKLESSEPISHSEYNALIYIPAALLGFAGFCIADQLTHDLGMSLDRDSLNSSRIFFSIVGSLVGMGAGGNTAMSEMYRRGLKVK